MTMTLRERLARRIQQEEPSSVPAPAAAATWMKPVGAPAGREDAQTPPEPPAVSGADEDVAASAEPTCEEPVTAISEPAPPTPGSGEAPAEQLTPPRRVAPIRRDPRDFVPTGVLEALGTLTPEQADTLAFGVIGLDDAGRILLYNRWQAEFARLSPSAAIGKSFFTQVAPCTNNALVHGAFKRGVAQDQLDSTFPYTFNYRLRPTNVWLRLYRHAPSRSNWLFVSRAD